MTITVTKLKDSVRLLSSLGENVIADSDEHALCYVAYHSNDVVLSGFFGNLVLCNMLQQYVGWVSMLLFSFLNARVIALSLCRAFKPN